MFNKNKNSEKYSWLIVERRSEILAGFIPAVLLTSDVPPESLFHLPQLVKRTNKIFSAMQHLKSIQRNFDVFLNVRHSINLFLLPT
jgi:hypothetical protein